MVSLVQRVSSWPQLPVAALSTAILSVVSAAAVGAAELFQASEVIQERFVIVSVPIGSTGAKAQLQIYEQIDPLKRPCFRVDGARPGRVDPLLGTFDFTGICRRYVDSQGYSARIGTEDLGSGYRFVVRKNDGDHMLVAAPAGGAAGKPEMVVARAFGTGAPTQFMALVLEPGWKVMRRAYGGRALGHVYLYRDGWPDAGSGPKAGSAAAGVVEAPASVPLAAPPVVPMAPPASSSRLRAPLPGGPKLAPVPSTSAAPTTATPATATPATATPATATPTSAAPAQAVPAQAVPTQAVPTQAVPTTSRIPVNRARGQASRLRQPIQKV